MSIRFVLAGATLVALSGSASAIGANQDYYIYHDMQAKKCTVVREKPTTGMVGSGETYNSEAAAKTALDKMPECTASQ